MRDAYLLLRDGGKGATYLTNNKKGGEKGDRYLASKPALPIGIKISLPVLTYISGDGKRRPEVTSSRGRSLALSDRLAVSLATGKRLPSAKDSFLSPDARSSKAFSDRGLRVKHLQTLAT